MPGLCPEWLVGRGASVYYAVLMKWLILFLVIWVAWRLFRVMRQPGPPRARSQRGEPMRACAHCGLNVPESEALIESTTLSYCCETHRRLGPASRAR